MFGAARGIGRAIAAAFAAEGCRVVGVDRDVVGGESFETFVQADVTHADDVARVTEVCSEAEHVVFSVGLGSGVSAFPYWKLSNDDWKRIVDVNLIGAANVANAFGPVMAERGRGSFLFLASVAAQVGSPTDPPYSAAKAGLINFMQVVARDLAPFGVRSNAISPGMVQTDLNKSVWAANQQDLPDDEKQTYEEWTDEKISRIAPLGRWQTAEEVAAVAVFLASEHARNITGQTINVDGGQVMHS